MGIAHTLFMATTDGVFVSPNSGESWQIDGELGRLHAVAVTPASDSVVYAGGDRGVFAGLDKGKTWSHLDNQHSIDQ
ncbi:MAG: hypothetical protein JO352_15050 [Chloroflexi bacterium]|nr:hypothetical protein [Chloroflexota bacterium]